jgi:broad specificity phosphatase PhoE
VGAHIDRIVDGKMSDVKSNPVKIFLARHGQSTYNRDSLSQGNDDPPLTELGEQQAVELAAQLAQQNISRIITSEKQRANKTGLIVARILDLPEPTRDARLNERVMNLKWAGFPRSVSRKTTEWRRSIEDPTFKLPGEESRMDLIKRVSSYLDDLFAQATENLLVVSHGGPVRVALDRYKEVSWDELIQEGAVTNGRAIEFDRNDSLRIALGVDVTNGAQVDGVRSAPSFPDMW